MMKKKSINKLLSIFKYINYILIYISLFFLMYGLKFAIAGFYVGLINELFRSTILMKEIRPR